MLHTGEICLKCFAMTGPNQQLGEKIFVCVRERDWVLMHLCVSVRKILYNFLCALCSCRLMQTDWDARMLGWGWGSNKSIASGTREIM